MNLQNQIEPYLGQYPPSMIEEFIDYWEEKNPKGKERWELEKTWEIGRRLKRWMRTQKKWDWEKTQRQTLKKVEEYPVHREPVAERVDGGFTSAASLFKKF